MGAMEFLLKKPMISRDNDIDLIHRIAAGDEDALRELYALCGQRLYAYALRLTGDPAAAEDVVQESLVAAWQGARRFRGEARVLTWMLGIVHHKALNALRSRHAQSTETGDEIELPFGEPAPDEQFARQERQRLVRAGLAQLSPDHRAALELVFYQGLSLKEAAEVCRCPTGTLKSRLSYARNHLRGLLCRAGLDGEDFG